MYAGGEIAELARMAKPKIGVVTSVHGVHMSRMGSLAAIEQAKGELVEALPVGRRSPCSTRTTGVCAGWPTGPRRAS